MIWADRVALVWAVLLWLIMVAHDRPGDADVVNALLVLAGIPWLLLRAVDFIATGGVRRLR